MSKFVNEKKNKVIFIKESHNESIYPNSKEIMEINNIIKQKEFRF